MLNAIGVVGVSIVGVKAMLAAKAMLTRETAPTYYGDKPLGISGG